MIVSSRPLLEHRQKTPDVFRLSPPGGQFNQSSPTAVVLLLRSLLSLPNDSSRFAFAFGFLSFKALLNELRAGG